MAVEAALGGADVSPEAFLFFFPSGSDQLTADGLASFDRLHAYLAAFPEVRALIAGHIDAAELAAGRTRLDDERANRLYRLLITRGIDQSRLEVAGRDNVESISGLLGPAEADPALDRRVDVVFQR